MDETYFRAGARASESLAEKFLSVSDGVILRPVHLDSSLIQESVYGVG